MVVGDSLFQSIDAQLTALLTGGNLYTTVNALALGALLIYPRFPVDCPSDPTGPCMARLHTSRKSPCLPAAHLGVSGSLTDRPETSGKS